MKKILNKKGFTLIELIVVIAILAILALILVPSISNYIAKATQAKNEANARTIYSEVALDVATGVITADGNVTKGGVYCEYTITNEEIDEFACFVGDEDGASVSVPE
ncbi:MAG: prepilin-type N-terminal cleavage/methylation domain-containing protein [Erysipelotrichaceae bacterium]